MSASTSTPGVLFATCPLLEQVPGIRHGFTSRHGGVSTGPYHSLNLATRVEDARAAVLENRHRVLCAMHRPAAQFLTLKQVHGADIVEVTANAGPNIVGDGFWTRDPRAVLAILVADCVPVILADRAARVVAAVHAGWRGTQAKIAAHMVQRLQAAGIAPTDLVAAMGPAIGPCCFEIAAEVAGALSQAFPHPGHAVQQRGDRWAADLWALNRRTLLEAGLPDAAIAEHATCTRCSAAYYSYRRDAQVTGRQAGVIALNPPSM